MTDQKAAIGGASAVGNAFGRVLTSLPPEHPFYGIIGRVAAEAARLEHTLDLIIWELSGLDQKNGSCITGQFGGSYQRFNAIEALAASRGIPKEILKRITSLSNKTSEVLKRRHRFVHDAAYTEGGDHAGQFRNFSAKDGSHGIQDVSEEYASESIELIKQKANEIGNLRNEIQKQLSTLR